MCLVLFVCCVLLVVWCSVVSGRLLVVLWLVVVAWSRLLLFVVCGFGCLSIVVVICSLFVVRCLLLVVCWSLIVVCCVFACCLWFVV